MGPRDRAEIECDLAAERESQLAEFLRDHKTALLKVATFFHWNAKGYELNGFDSRLLPDGFECPPNETYAELKNALDFALQRMTEEDEFSDGAKD